MSRTISLNDPMIRPPNAIFDHFHLKIEIMCRHPCGGKKTERARAHVAAGNVIWKHLGNVAQFARDWEKGGGFKCKYRRETTVFGVLGNAHLYYKPYFLVQIQCSKATKFTRISCCLCQLCDKLCR